MIYDNLEPTRVNFHLKMNICSITYLTVSKYTNSVVLPLNYTNSVVLPLNYTNSVVLPLNYTNSVVLPLNYTNSVV